MIMDFYFQRMTTHYEQQVFSLNELIVRCKKEQEEELEKLKEEFSSKEANLQEVIQKMNNEASILKEENVS